MAEMIQTILKLAGDEASRGDLKILNRSLKELRYASSPVDIALTIPIIIKNQLFLIPSTHDVIEGSLEMYSLLPGHAAKLWQVFNNVNKTCLTPSTFIVGGGVA